MPRVSCQLPVVRCQPDGNVERDRQGCRRSQWQPVADNRQPTTGNWQLATGFWILFIALAAVCGPALARNADGTLGLIQTPNGGVPALVTPGGTFDAELSEKAALSLSGSDPVPELTVTWSELPGRRARARCTVAGNAKAGAYALEARAGERVDQNVRAVFVREAFPPFYAVAHITDVHIGAERGKRPSRDTFRAVIQTLNASEAAFAVVTGDLTENGTLEQFQSFVEILDTCALPTFVCAGNHDRAQLNYERCFGPVTYLFRFGEDGYLVFDTKDFNVADELGRQDADLEVFRRALKPSRWTIGLTHRYEPDQGLRSQQVLFVDNPLDHLIFGHWHRENSKDQKTVPWGTTKITVTPAAKDGAYRLFDITSRGIHPRPVQQAPGIE